MEGGFSGCVPSTLLVGSDWASAHRTTQRLMAVIPVRWQAQALPWCGSEVRGGRREAWTGLCCLYTLGVGLFHLDEPQFPSLLRGTLVKGPWRVILRGNTCGHSIREGQGQFLL